MNFTIFNFSLRKIYKYLLLSSISNKLLRVLMVNDLIWSQTAWMRNTIFTSFEQCELGNISYLIVLQFSSF